MISTEPTSYSILTRSFIYISPSGIPSYLYGTRGTLQRLMFQLCQRKQDLHLLPGCNFEVGISHCTWNFNLFPATDEVPALQPLPHLVPPLRLGVRQELGEYEAVVTAGQRLIGLLFRFLHAYPSFHRILTTFYVF